MLSEAPIFGVWHCVSCQDLSGDSASKATSDVVMQEIIEDRDNSRSPEWMSLSLSACGSIASGRGGKEEELADSRAKLCSTSAIPYGDESKGVDRELGTKVGQSRSDPATESRRGLSLASSKLRLSREGLGAWASDAMGRDGKGFSKRARWCVDVENSRAICLTCEHACDLAKKPGNFTYQ